MSADHHVDHQQQQHHPHHDYRSSDEEVEEVVPTHKKRQAVTAASRCLLVNYGSGNSSSHSHSQSSKTPTPPPDEDSIDDNTDDDDIDSGSSSRHHHPAAPAHSQLLQQRSSILNHTSHSHVPQQQPQHNHHPHILSNHSGGSNHSGEIIRFDRVKSSDSSNGSNNSSSNNNNGNNHNNPVTQSLSTSSVPLVNHVVHTATGSHVIACSSASSLHRNADNPLYLSKGENGQQLAYRVVQMAELQHQQHQSQQQQQHLNNNPAHQHAHHPHHHSDAAISGPNHQATLLGLSGAPALLSAASPAHYHPHGSGNADGGDGGSGRGSPTAGYYVMMGNSSGSSDHIQIHGTPAPRKKSNSINVADLSCASTSGRNSRDERRRATHNEVERRRRDKINNWITKLAKLVPDCNQDHTKQGQSKGGILAKTCDHICDLEQRVSHYRELAKDREILATEVLALRDQLNSASCEIRRLRSLLAKQGVQQQQEDLS